MIGDSKEPLDRAALGEVFANDDAALLDFAANALGELRPMLDEMVERVRHCDTLDALRVAHDLKGAASGIGATEFAAAIAEAERALTSSDSLASSSALARSEVAFELVVAWIDRRRGLL